MAKYRISVEEIMEDGSTKPFPIMDDDESALLVDGFALMGLNHDEQHEHVTDSWESVHNISVVMLAEAVSGSKYFKRASQLALFAKAAGIVEEVIDSATD